MVGASKILTVSYGTFSCTLEGFDEPFNTMKAIAEYFRDLAAEDRYFGAEPPTPDADMLHRIAEREIQRRVEAKVGKDGIVLRPQESAEIPAAVAAPVAAPEPVATAPLVPPPAAAVAEPEQDSVAAKLQRIRAAVATARAAAQPYVEDEQVDTFLGDSGAVTEDFGFELDLSGPLLSEDESSDAPQAAAPEAVAPEAAKPEPMRLPDPERARRRALRRAARAAALAAPALPAAVEDRAADALAVQVAEADLAAIATVAAAAPPAEPGSELVLKDATTAVAFEAEPFDLQMASVAEYVATAIDGAAEFEDASDGVALQEASAAAEAIEWDSFEGEFEAEPVELDAIVAENASPETIGAEVVVLHPDLASAAMDEPTEDEAFLELMSEALDETRLEAPADSDQLAGAAQDDLPEVEIEALLAALIPDGVEDIAETAATEAAEVEELAPAEAVASEPEELEAFLETLDPEVSASADIAEIAEDAEARDLEELLAEVEDLADKTPEAATVPEEGDEPVAITPPTDHPVAHTPEEGVLSRLLKETNSKLEVAENRRRFSAIAHLKAAVAATVADRLLRGGSESRAKPADETEAYRDDLTQAVRPRRPTASGAAASARPALPESRPAPLVLVSEQRIDRKPEAAPAAPVVRPRRISAAQIAAQRDEDAQEQAGAERPAAAEATSFAEFAESMGTSGLADLLEAAAAYTATVEGRPHFSPPQIMKKVAAVADEGHYTREDGLRSFGQLLRQGKIAKIRRGQYQITEQSRFWDETRRAAN